MNTQRTRSILLWRAALAILCGVLAPALAASVAASPVQQGKTWIAVCMSAGTKLVAPDASAAVDGVADDRLVHPGMHCPACVSQQDLASVAHPPASLMLLGAPGRLARHRGPALPPAAAIHAAHRSRAPPLPA